MSAHSTDGPFTWNVSGLLADGVGADRTYDINGATIDLPDELELAGPIFGQVRLNTDQPRGPGRRPPGHLARR